MSETRIHPLTGKELSRQTRKQTVSFGSLSEEIDVPGWYPDDDSDSIHSGADLREKENALRRLGQAYGMRVRSIRKKLNLTQVEAGFLIGGGSRAFHKYEKGTMPPSEAAVGLLEILFEDPAKIAVLKAFRKRAEISTMETSDQTVDRRTGRRDRATA